MNRILRNLLAGLPLLLAAVIVLHYSNVLDEAPDWVGYPVSACLGVVAGQWGRLVTRVPGDTDRG